MRQLFGFSMSFCVKSILAREVDLSQVNTIFCSTMFETPEQAVDGYYEGYWAYAMPRGREDLISKEEALALVTELWPRMVQPRLRGRSYHNIAHCYRNPWFFGRNRSDAWNKMRRLAQIHNSELPNREVLRLCKAFSAKHQPAR